MENAPALLKNSLNFKIYRLAGLLRRELIRALRPYNLTPERWQILAALWEQEHGVSQSWLCAITLKDAPSISRLVAAMEKEGWIERPTSREDSRAFLVKATHRARAMRSSIVSSLQIHFSTIMSGFPVDSQKQLKTLVDAYLEFYEPLEKPN